MLIFPVNYIGEISSLATNQMLFSGLTFLVTYHRRDNNSTGIDDIASLYIVLVVLLESSAVGALSRKKIEDLIHKGGGIIMGNYTPNMVNLIVIFILFITSR